MIIKILVVGKTKDSTLKSLQRKYLQRLTRYTKVQLVAVRDSRAPRGQKATQASDNQTKRILKEIDRRDFCVLLDSRGKGMTSPELAHFLEKHLLDGTGRMVFVIGGPLGLTDEAKNRADAILSFSKFTFTHEIIRVLLLEQLYRAWTLLRGEKYHK
jgi:23S rRNA (pseudouridine1915-N3)-methyltransferase